MKIYKKIKIKIIGILFIAGLSSCELLMQEPISDLTADSFWKSQTDAEVGVAAIYS